MPITQRDVMLLLTMALAIVSMSFVFPALGLGGDQVQSNEIPEFDIDEDRFDLAGDFPEVPGSPSSGDLVWEDGRDDQLNRDYIRGDTSGGLEIFVDPDAPTGYNASVTLNEWDSGNVIYTVDFLFSEVGDEHVYVNQSMGIEMTMEATEISDDRDVVRYTVESRTDGSGGGGWLENVPLIGGAVEVASATGAVLGWFVEVFVWAALFLFDLIANTVAIGGEVAVYLVSLLAWMSTTYTGIVSAAQGWASVFVALPGVIFGTVLAKFVIIAVGLLPTT